MNLFAAGVVVRKDGKFLMVQEAKEKVRGLWNWPAGHRDGDETIEDCAKREAKEETGFDIELTGEIGLWARESEPDNPNVRKKLFLGKVVGGEAKVQAEDVLNVQWFTEEEIRAMTDKIRSGWVIESLDILRKRSL